ncbi:MULTISPECIES: pyridoxamine 5'-phosphate oxidase family protein [Streptomycetaceae]|uniref:Pyridoxamine 5'-phosphate oxidase N-terminal domain-containing protein n=1 Tax=Streptantibioticus cattleyicolor (strain ATCC 35852 / DSM 46488 / JCM 4925 / NBRC 14057 / NRRL 8057) TaxID=1003195 RepID=F8JP33_STREN|nr:MULTISPECIES: pyridoxamine 5'-phosphate oxidase family protein [Streptomycetaceae]AEW93985.1 hypothetical protein SCATT_16140 [Streptantibioticus cattleyicolor NRRL 8057 = DSM 46488]MYS58659.1 pyridoxamine 5'-phosphate oxidase [Streptomyces sp. SID5468]CCB74329.1 conserved protein of unknown function [Streptantibioticus cattleyicolor NRRL 8057 = DSM 46488]
MTHPESPRSLALRKRQALHRLDHDQDVWVATADGDGVPCLVPLYFWWDGHAVWIATRGTNPTGVNLSRSGLARLSFGHTRDVVLMAGTATDFARDGLPAGVGDAFAAKFGWDPREDHPSYRYFRIVPELIQAWGTVAEMADRTLMRDGRWLL